MMIAESIENRYYQLLKAHFTEPQGMFLHSVTEIGREIVKEGVPIEDVAKLHEKTIDRLERESPNKKLLENNHVVFQPLMELLIVYGAASRKRFKEQKRAEALAATGQMAGRIAHEINNPLAGLKNSFALIKDAIPDDHPDRKFSSYIDKEIDRIANIVRQMFVLYKPPKVPADDIYLVDAINDVILMLEAECKQRGIAIDFRGPDQSLKMSAPEGSFQQVLYNVIVNAIEASPDRGIVSVTASIDERKLELVVSDQGNGIPEEIGDRIFEPFFSTKGNTSSGGLGLGLSVSRSLAQAMNGSIEYKSDPGKGTEFKIAWPLSS